jgi:H/ACA ribonucleoprotein complex subunit 4
MNIEKIKSQKSIKELLEFGLINIDKPTGPTSFWTSQFVKKTLGLRKTSHLGTLDPMVTGVLPVALNRACKLNDYFMHRNKVYVGIMRLHVEVPEKKLREEMKELVGKIVQLPPVRSRAKRAEREREIKSFEILEIDGKDVLFSCDVQAGTYVRKLIHDLGEKIGGAHMLELRRTRAGLFGEQKVYTLYEFEDAVNDFKLGDEKKLREMIVPAEIVSELLPVLQIRKDVLRKCMTGSPIFKSFLASEKDIDEVEKGEKVCVFCDEQFVGCYNFIGEGDLVAKAEFVFN